MSSTAGPCALLPVHHGGSEQQCLPRAACSRTRQQGDAGSHRRTTWPNSPSPPPCTPGPPRRATAYPWGSCRLCPHRCITSQPCPLVTGRQTLGSHQLAACPQAGPCPSSLRPLLLKWGDTNFLRGAINKQGAGRRDVGGAASLAVSLTLQIPCGAVHGRCGDNSLVWRRGG